MHIHVAKKDGAESGGNNSLQIASCHIVKVDQSGPVEQGLGLAPCETADFQAQRSSDWVLFSARQWIFRCYRTVIRFGALQDSEFPGAAEQWLRLVRCKTVDFQVLQSSGWV